jgi:probable F420-dependent oxidoreductase
MPRSAATAEIGLFAPTSWPAMNRDALKILGPAAEERGFAEIWVPEHVAFFESRTRPLGGVDTGTFDPVVTLTYLAAHTGRIRLGTGVTLLSQRQPVFLAKEIASLDHLSGGRVDVGAGVGWIREEFQALGLRREDRGLLTDRNLELLRTLWTDPVSEYHGPGYDLPACRAYPKPVQVPHPPLYIGGHSDAALRRVARYGQGWYPFNLDLEAFTERRAALAALVQQQGRSIDEIRIVTCPYRHPADYDAVCRYLDAGAAQVILWAAQASGRDLGGHLDVLAEQVIAKLG